MPFMEILNLVWQLWQNSQKPYKACVVFIVSAATADFTSIQWHHSLVAIGTYCIVCYVSKITKALFINSSCTDLFIFSGDT